MADALITLVEYIGCMCTTPECSGECIAAKAEAEWRELTGERTELRDIKSTVRANAEGLARLELLYLLSMTAEQREEQSRALNIDLDDILATRQRQVGKLRVEA